MSRVETGWMSRWSLRKSQVAVEENERLLCWRKESNVGPLVHFVCQRQARAPPRPLTSPGPVHDVWARIRRVSSLDSSKAPHLAFLSKVLPYDAITAGLLPQILCLVCVRHSHHEPRILEALEPSAPTVVCAKVAPCFMLSPIGIPSIPLQIIFYNQTLATRSVRGKGQEAEPAGPRRAGATSPSAPTPGQTAMAPRRRRQTTGRGGQRGARASNRYLPTPHADGAPQTC